MKTTIEKLQYLLLIIVLLIMASCREDETDSLSARPFDPEETETTIEGQVLGRSFEANDGKVEIRTVNLTYGQTQELLRIELHSIYDFDERCGISFRNEEYLIITPENEVGVYRLSRANGYSNSAFFNTRRVTSFYDFYDGSIEITSIDEIKVIGRLDFRRGDENWMRGDFEVRFCEE